MFKGRNITGWSLFLLASVDAYLEPLNNELLAREDIPRRAWRAKQLFDEGKYKTNDQSGWAAVAAVIKVEFGLKRYNHSSAYNDYYNIANKFLRARFPPK